ncbi:hypothetical protein BKE38_07350 [Pseudoroseomonas deserti]|uniref:DUF616 domain-containing protein n=1 Tax=Teichococcus deserti TaxID=1817963 RepID=A0A1V2H5K0_9PROT|nr:hypothetical protein [Pseudoroseomonas deserti]ONG55969.1 hypothetical protein BKE38_07350 [Pseudoroseomonas deserti]
MAIPDAGPGGPRRCVYTLLTGGYERLTEQPAAARSTLPFLCLTDDPALRSDSWQIRQVAPCLPRDPVRSQRAMELLPHRLLPDFDLPLDIHNSVLLTAPPEDRFAQLAAGQGLALPAHRCRDRLPNEFLEVSWPGYDDQGRIFEQLNHDQPACPEALAQPPPWTAILLRDHGDARMRRAMELWLAHVLRCSRRDQLSAGIALARRDARDATGEAALHLRAAEAAAEQATRASPEILQSTSWRLLAPLQAWLARHPRLLAGLRRVLRPGQGPAAIGLDQ